MKRIIDGITYNTATAIKIAHRRRGDDRYDHVTMYQTRKRAFLFCLHSSEGADDQLLVGYEDPKRFLEHANEVYINPFSSSPAGMQGEAAIFIRAPESLKRSVEQAAQEQGVSVNHLAVRCLEKCTSKTKS